MVAKNNNINSLGITDSTMFGTMEFINSCNKNNIKPIIGVPFEMNNIFFTLYCTNYEGLVILFKLVSKRNTDKLELNDFKNLTNIKCVCDIDNYDDLKLIFDIIYIKNENENERINALKVNNKIINLS